MSYECNREKKTICWRLTEQSSMYVIGMCLVELLSSLKMLSGPVVPHVVSPPEMHVTLTHAAPRFTDPFVLGVC